MFFHTKKIGLTLDKSSKEIRNEAVGIKAFDHYLVVFSAKEQQETIRIASDESYLSSLFDHGVYLIKLAN